MRSFLRLCLACLMLGVFSARADPQLDAIVNALQGIDDPGIQASFLKGMLGGLAGQRDVGPPKGWAELKSKLEKQGNEEVLGLVGQIGQVFGDESAGDSALTTLLDKKASLDDRKIALSGLVAQKNPKLPPKLALLLDQPIGTEAIRAYSAFDFKAGPRILLSRYSKLGPEERRVVVETLASRKSYARALVVAMGKGKVAKEEIPAYVARNLHAMLGDSFEKVYGKVQPVSAGQDKLIAKYKSMVLASDMSQADASKGRAIYQRTCLACHIMYGEGGKIGPELTGSNRSDLDYFLLNVLAPSYDVPEGDRMVIITSKDGQVSVGNVIEENANKVVLNMVGQQSVIAKTDVKTRVTSKISMMPEGLLLTLKDPEILDLIKYLRTEKQVPLPKP
jgi:putative heme-binding domain-containing protein